ncbi:MAG: peptidase [Pirellulaceae bacterium]|nr:MAG: peptidase [Pirellulaceae bacterium]GIW94498.1 MAG: peptidase [Pirellulaceae bacterium]
MPRLLPHPGISTGTLLLFFAVQLHAQPASVGPPVVIHLEGEVGPVMVQSARRSLEKARRWNPPCVVFEIDSPGGLLASGLKLAEMFQEIGWTRTVVFIPREALSSAAIASLGCREIYLSEQARFGNAGPIYLGAGGLFRHVPEKIRSDVALRVRQLAAHHDRPPAVAEAMVDSELQVFEYHHRQTGQRRYLSEREWQGLEDRDQWVQGAVVPESGQGRFLEVTGRRAVELGLATAVVADRDQLWERLGVSGAPIEFRPQAIDYAVVILNHPLVTGILFVAGLVALYIELSAPGIGLGGLVALVSFSLFFWSRFLGGTADWLELVMFLVGIILLGIELLLVPGLAVFGITGLLLIVSSLVLASQDFIVPHTAQQRQQMSLSFVVLVVSGVAFLAAAVLLARYFGRVPVLNRMMLPPPSARSGTSSIEQGPVVVGTVGVAETPLRPGGKASFGSAYVDVVATGEFIEAGQPIEVVEIYGHRIVVRPCSHRSGSTGKG